MTNLKLAFAVGLATASLALTLALAIGGVPVVVTGIAAVVGISAILAGTVAFIVSREQRSFPVAGLLASSGIIFTINALMATGYLAVIVFPGPIIGVFLGLAVLGMELAKGIGMARKVTVSPARSYTYE
jgi:hypothetical protein